MCRVYGGMMCRAYGGMMCRVYGGMMCRVWWKSVSWKQLGNTEVDIIYH